jgi:hypothetical protein
MNKPSPETNPSDAFREKVFALTLPALNRRVRRKSMLMLCALSAAYIIGLFSAAWYLAPQAAAPPVQSASAQKHSPLPADDGLHDAERAALMAARESPEQRREALREAGNRWLDVQGDIARATQLYGRFLDTIPADELGRFDPNETWLLRALRCARLQENAHENEST